MENPDLPDWRTAVAEDLRVFSRLHAEEISEKDWLALRESHFPSCRLLPCGEAAQELIQKGLDCETEDFLAAEFSSIYLTAEYRSAPQESAWTDEEGLLRQGSMFQTRDIYSDWGLKASDWANFPEDHLSVELEFLARLILSPSQRSTDTAHNFLKNHLLNWIPRFADRVASRTPSAFYAGLALGTVIYCERLLETLTEGAEP